MQDVPLAKAAMRKRVVPEWKQAALMGKFSYKLKFKDFVIFLSSYPNKFQSYQKLQQQTATENEAETADILQNDSFAQVNIK